MRRLLILILAVSAGPAFPQEVRGSLVVDWPLTGSLETGQVDRYTVELDNERFIYLEVDQLTVDARVVVRDPAGLVIDTVDGPARGVEAVGFETAASGVYAIDVAAFKDSVGDYTIELQRVERTARNPERRLDQLLAGFSGNDVPGAVVAVIEDGRITHRQAVGMADLSWGVPFEADTVSNIGSVSKQFTAFAVVLLAKEGKLSLDDDVRDYFPSLPDLGAVVTVRNLLNHTSGYREFLNLLGMTGLRPGLGDYIPRESVLDMLERQPEFQDLPGTHGM